MPWPARRPCPPGRPSSSKEKPRCWPTGSSSDHVGFQIRLERLRNANFAVGLLVSFEQRDEQTRQRGAAAVEDVGEFVFARFGFEAQVHAPRLKVFTIRTA